MMLELVLQPRRPWSLETCQESKVETQRDAVEYMNRCPLSRRMVSDITKHAARRHQFHLMESTSLPRITHPSFYVVGHSSNASAVPLAQGRTRAPEAHLKYKFACRVLAKTVE